MNIEKYTERARGFIQSAQGLALRSNHQQLLPQHLLKVLIDDEEGLAARLIRAAGGPPDQVRSDYKAIHSPDATVHAFAKLAGAASAAVESWALPDVDTAFDLRHARRLDGLCSGWIEPALAAVASKRIGALRLLWADGERFDVRRSQALRFWKRPLRVLAERDDA